MRNGLRFHRPCQIRDCVMTSQSNSKRGSTMQLQYRLLSLICIFAILKVYYPQWRLYRPQSLLCIFAILKLWWTTLKFRYDYISNLSKYIGSYWWKIASDSWSTYMYQVTCPFIYKHILINVLDMKHKNCVRLCRVYKQTL